MPPNVGQRPPDNENRRKQRCGKSTMKKMITGPKAAVHRKEKAVEESVQETGGGNDYPNPQDSPR